jgi:FkbM family methyltransferase
MKSFATYGEDAIFEGICKRYEWLKGAGEYLPPQKYVEIGGFHPIIDSNTYHFYKERGWAGSIFEPNWIHNYYFETDRPRDKFYNFAVSDYNGQADFFIFSDGDNSNTINFDFANLKTKAQRTPVKQMRQVQVIDLAKAFDLHNEHFGDEIFLLSIDAEGEDAKIINGYAFDKYRPKFIMVEDTPSVAFMPNLSVIRSLLLTRNYLPVAASLLTTIYVDGNDEISTEILKMGEFE